MSAPLYHKLTAISTLFGAWKVVRAKGAAGGIDGLTIKLFEEDINKHLSNLSEELKTGQWKPYPYKQVMIPKNDTEKRRLGMLSVRDKIVQTAIKQLIEPRFEKLFLNQSYAYRQNKGHNKAIRRTVQECRKKENQYVVRLDIDDYFDTIPQEILFQRLSAIVSDIELFRLIQLCVKMGVVTAKGKWEETTLGVPQGAVLSPILANLYLHSFDQFILTRSNSYIRYADDFIILCKNENEARKILEEATQFLSERLLLKLNEPVVSKISEGIEFLGIMIYPDRLGLSEKKRKKITRKINTFSLQQGIFGEKDKKSWQGLHRYYGMLLPQQILAEIDSLFIEKVNIEITQKHAEIANKSVLQKTLCEFDFLTFENQKQAKHIRNQATEFYLQLKNKGKVEKASTQNKKIVAQRKLEYQKRENENSELVISTFGVAVGISNQKITVREKGKIIQQIPTLPLKHISIQNKGVSISSNLIAFCMEHKIGISFFEEGGKLSASILSPQYLSTTLWKKQALLPDIIKMNLAKSIIVGKLKNQHHLIQYFHKYHKVTFPHLIQIFENSSTGIKSLINSLKQFDEPKSYQEKIMGMEAQGALLYWDYIKALLQDDEVDFRGRERKGASDLVNAMLNYAYSILYARVWKALLAVKLNPSEPLLHAPQNYKPTLVFDMVEIFRAQAADRVVFSLIQKGFTLNVKDGRLIDETKKLLIKNVLERMNRYEKYRGEEMKFSQIIQYQAKELAEAIENETKFKPYIAKW